MEASPASKPASDFVASRTAFPSQKPPSDLRVLVVDNDGRRAEVIKRQWESARTDRDDCLKLVGHGLEAMVVAEEFQPELVIMHLGVPRRSGVCTAQLLRARPWAAKVVIVSYTTVESDTEAPPSDVDFHFFSGIDVSLLMQMIMNLQLRRSNMHRVGSPNDHPSSPRMAQFRKRAQQHHRTAQ